MRFRFLASQRSRHADGRSLEQKLAYIEDSYRAVIKGERFLQGVLIALMAFLGTLLGSAFSFGIGLIPYLCGAVFCGLAWWWVLFQHSKKVVRSDWLKHFECQVENLSDGSSTSHSLSTALKESDPIDERLWSEVLAREGRELLSVARQSWVRLLIKLAAVVLMCVLIGGMFADSIHKSARSSLGWLGLFDPSITLTIGEGAADRLAPQKVKLSVSSPPTIQVHEHNLLHMLIQSSYSRDDEESYSVALHGWFPSLSRDTHKESSDHKPRHSAPLSVFLSDSRSGALKQAYQSFVAVPQQNQFLLSFRVSQNSAVFVPNISTTKPMAYVSVGAPSVPEVGLVWHDSPADETITDHEPIYLSVSAVSPHPLVKLNLVIQTQAGEFIETVTQILAQDQLSIVHRFSTHLRPYVTAREEHIHLYGEAISVSGDGGDAERETVGRSDPVSITVISSYGRYQQTLEALKQARQQLMDWPQEDDSSHISRLAEIAETIQKSSQQTPFFNYQDRDVISSMVQQMESKSLDDEFFREDLRATLIHFLEIHEALDHRERDRDFFVSARGYSSMLQMSQTDSSPNLKAQGGQLENFVKQREVIWQKRAQNLDEKFWQQHEKFLSENYFSQAIQDITQSSPESSPESVRLAVARIAELVSAYDQWIKDLEAAEDQARQDRILRHSQILSSAVQALKQLQKSQDHIASRLDPQSDFFRPGNESTSSQSHEWPEIRSDQQQAISQGQVIANQLREISRFQGPSRLDEALKAMGGVIDKGDQQSFQDAEVLADRASRLLREGGSAAQTHQNRFHQSQLTPRTQVGGDNYYGSSVIHLNMKASHKVDAFYREDILKQMSESHEHTDPVLNSRYLREMLR